MVEHWRGGEGGNVALYVVVGLDAGRPEVEDGGDLYCMEGGPDIVREVVAMVWVVLKSWIEAQVVFHVGWLNAL